MGQTRALFCDEESCNRLGAIGYTGHWIEVPALDVDFCSVTCALEYSVGFLFDGDRTLIDAAVDRRAAINPEARAEAAAWRAAHEELLRA
ncbi:MAG: hypothetical protein AB7G21_09755 [Dehalococcoidia bacterium]